MMFAKSAVLMGFAAIASAGLVPASISAKNQTYGCGEVNVFYTGFPGYHKTVAEQGIPQWEADEAIKNSTKEMVYAGYNVAMVLSGPEMDIGLLKDEMEGTKWHVTAIGAGMRGCSFESCIGRFEDNLMLFREQGPRVPTVFNRDPWTFTWSVSRRFPIGEDCTNKPGKLIVYKEICEDACSDRPEGVIPAIPELEN